ncbi:major facilitator superfamily domain-containing protein [Xylogone sp. PMI_703]|nr:major facilitator superfamily domain-containing protein [Xylogone sp. PMI_703]
MAAEIGRPVLEAQSITGREKDETASEEAIKSSTSDLENNNEKNIEPPPQQVGAPPAPAAPQFADGGRLAWQTVAGGWCCMFVSLGWINSIGVFQTIYEENQLKGYSPSTIAWILSLETFVMFGGAPFYGKVFDSYGPRFLLLGGSFLHVFGLMMLSLCKEYYQFLLAQSICSALGASAIFYASTNSIATWFKKNRALALGIASSGSACGGLIIPILVEQMNRKVSFGWAIRTTAFIFLGLLIISNTLLRSALKHTPKPFNIMDFVNPLKEPRFVLVSMACFMIFLSVFQPSTFIVLDAVRHGMSNDTAFYLIAVLNAVSAVGRILAGRVADKIGRFNCMIIVNLLSAIFTLALWIPGTSHAALWVYAAFIGATSGAFVALVAAVIGQISDIRQIGIRNGTNFFCISFAALIGNPIAGALINRDNGGYLYMQIFSGVGFFVGSCLFLASRVYQVGPGWKIC